MNETYERDYGCWVRVGSYGHGSCERLPEGGCRDCPDYQARGLGLYDREPPEGYALEWTRILAGEKLVESEDATSMLVFRIGGEWLALRTARFEEIIPLRRAHAVPSLKSPAFLGLVNISGELLPCLSLAVVLGMSGNEGGKEEAAATRAVPRMAVISGRDGRFVFPVDEIIGVHRVTRAERRETPATVSRTPSHFSSGVFLYRGAVAGILDEEALFPALSRSITG